MRRVVPLYFALLFACSESQPSHEDAGPLGDGGPEQTECPANIAEAEGAACAVDGQSCGSCTSYCGFCNILRCEGGRWQRLEAFPPPPPCTPFPCGPDRTCGVEQTYCEVVGSDVGGEPNQYFCKTLPADCTSCECLADALDEGFRDHYLEFCEQDENGGITLFVPGG